MEPETSSLDDIEGRVVADSFEGSSSKSDRDDTKYENENEAHSKYENENEAYSTPPGSTTTDQKMMIAIPNPASAAADSKAANPKRLLEEKVDINGSENVIDVLSERKKAKVAMSITSPVVIDVNKPNNKSSSTGITWTDNEEIVILGGLISLKAENRPYKPKEFYRYIKDRLGQGDLIQVREKVKSLKKKYIKMQEKAQNQMSFANSHEEKVFTLSKIYWGEIKNGGTKKTNKLNKEVKTLVVQQPEENSNQIIFNNKEVQVKAQLDKEQKKKEETDQKMPKKNDHDHDQKKNPKEKNDHDHGPKNDLDHDQKKNQKEKSDQILRDSLRHYLERESIDSKWVDNDQLATLINLWNNVQLSKVRYDLAISEFDVELKQRALEAYKEFGYENDP